MRKNRAGRKRNGYSMLVLDDDKNITEALKAYFSASGYEVDTENNPVAALDKMRQKHYDILLLDYIMSPICGDEVVCRLREFDKRIYVLLLTGHREIAPPLNTIRELDIQGYFEKSDRYDQLELLVESCVKSICQMKTVYKYQDGLSKILEAIPHMHQLKPLEELAHQMLEEILDLAECREGFVWIKPRNIIKSFPQKELPVDIYWGTGGYDKDFERFLEQDYSQMEREAVKSTEENSICLAGDTMLVPLYAGKQSFLGIFGLKKESLHSSELLSVFAEQVSTALHNTILNLLLNLNNQQLSEAYRQMKENYMQTVEALRLLVDAKDIYTRGHSDRVAYFCKAIAERISKDKDFIECVRTAGLLHDVGKIGVSDAVLCKNGPLSDEEFATIKKHPEQGAQILTCMTMFDNLGSIICAHHEWYDGTGYPYGLSGEKIPMEARIIAVADAFDAMMSDRHYRGRLSFTESISQLEEGRNTQFDGKIVDVFLELLENFAQMQRELQWTYAKAE